MLEAFTGTGMFYLLIVVGIFAIGDFLGVVTKARLSSVFVALILFLVGFLTGFLPPDIIEKAGLSDIAKLAVPLIIFHMGTMINLKQLISEWTTVVTAALSMIVVAVAIFAISVFIGKENAIVAIPILHGGVVSTQIMTERAMELGFTSAAALGTILYATQKFAGAYPASFFGRKEAKIILEDFRKNKATNSSAVSSAKNTDITKEKQTFATKHNKYFTDFICIGISVVFAWLANGLGSITPISYSIWALLFGATLGHLNVVPKRILEKGKASGFLSILIFATIMPSLAKISLEDLLSLGILTLVILVVTVLALFLVFYISPGWKIAKSKNLAMGIAMGQLLGFPATFLIANEIAKATTDDEEEQEAILNVIMPKYVVAGITTVTVLSIVVAGIFSNFL